MATTPFAFQAASGETLTVKFEAGASGVGTPAASYSATEKTTAKGWYTISIPDVITGGWFWHAENGGGTIITNGVAYFADTTAVHFGYDPVSHMGYSWLDTYVGQFSTSDRFAALIVDTNTKVGNISAGSSAVSTTASSFTSTSGGTQTNTYTATQTLDGTYHSNAPNAGTTDIYYEFNVGPNGVPTSVDYWGFTNSQSDTYLVYAYNWGTASWEQIGSRSATNSSTVLTANFSLTISHVGTGANDGKVRIRFYSTGATTGTNISIDRLLCNYTVINAALGYEGGAVWVDTVSGTSTGTTPSVDGIVTNRSTTFNNAQAIATALGYRSIHVTNGNTVTLSQTINTFRLGRDDDRWSLALGGQDVGGCTILSANVSGVATGTGVNYSECIFGANTTITAGSVLRQCGFAGTLTIGSAGDIFIIDGFSEVSGASAPIIDMGAAIGATNMSVRRWAGGITLNNLAAGDIVSLDGVFGTITMNGADASIEVRGIYKDLVNNMTGSPSVNLEGAIEGGVLGYEGGYVWIDNVSGVSTGTVVGFDGTISRRSTTFNNAQALATSLGYKQIAPTNGNTVTLSQAITGFYIGIPDSNWSLVLGGQAINTCDIHDAHVSGVSSGSNNQFHNCDVAACTVGPAHFDRCGVEDIITCASSGTYELINCWDADAGAGAPGFNLASNDNNSVIIRNWRGGITISGIAANDSISLDGVMGTVTLNGVGGEVVVSGQYRALVDNRTGSPTLTDGGSFIGSDVKLGKDQATIAARNVQK